MSAGPMECGPMPSLSEEHLTARSCYITEQAVRRMRESSHSLLRTVQCRFDNGVLRLKGRVPSFYLKQLVQSLVENIDGVERIDNQVDVTR